MATRCKRICDKLKVGPMIISALVTRVAFCLHCLVAIWRISVFSGWNPVYSLVFCGLVGLFTETVVTLRVRKGAEYKWFCPSVFCYLATIVPCIWILEFGLLYDENEQADLIPTGIPQDVFPVNLAQTKWVVVIEQLMLFVLILGRWMLPKGDLSRDELSQLLLVYIGMAADISELLQFLGDKQARDSRALAVIILSIWSVSPLQFTLVLTVSKSRKDRGGVQDTAEQELQELQEPESPSSSTGKCHRPRRCKSGACCSCCSFDSEVAGITTTMVLQDGPFLTLRLLLLTRYEVRSSLHIFFTMKNALVLLLMLYRLVVIFIGRRKRAQAQAKTQAQAQTHAHDEDEVIGIGAIEEDKSSASIKTE